MTIDRLDWSEQPPAGYRGGAVTLGNFDGVHRGHAALLAEVVAQARQFAGPAVAVTFDPHPLQLLRPAQFQPVLTTAADRAELLLANGADHVLILNTTPDLLGLSAVAFFDEVIRRRLDARAVVEGPNFGFGHQREGDVALLGRLCQEHSLTLRVVPPVTVDGAPVSSSRVRRTLVHGDVRAAADLLGRPYRVRGTVTVGQKRGRTLGFPTANLTGVETVLPADGVYAVRVHAGDAVWPGAANLGPNPTFGEQARKVEIHLIGFDGDLYDRRLAVDFLERLRPTRPFGSVQELVAQLRQDIDQARQVAAERGTK